MLEIETERLILRADGGAGFRRLGRADGGPRKLALHRRPRAPRRGVARHDGDGRRLVAAGLRHVFDGRKSERSLDRPHRPLQPEGWPGTEVGWGVLASAAGKGLAHEAAVASIDWAFDALGWSEVIHCIDPANTPSQRLAARLGSRKPRPRSLPAPYAHFEVEIWGQTKAEWRARTLSD
jgi:hypothetical protein